MLTVRPSPAINPLDHNVLVTELKEIGFVEERRPLKKLAELRRDLLTIYIKRETAHQSLVVHPVFEAAYSNLAGLPGVTHEGRLFFHHSGLSKFPKRDNGRGLIGYGIAFDVTTRVALHKFVGELDRALTSNVIIVPEKTLRDELVEAETETTLLAKARVGQGRFRADLLDHWNGRCPLTGISAPELLRASHIKPWSESNNAERLDPFNGLLLAVHLDALFDHALISFDDIGEILVSSKLTTTEREVFGLQSPLPTRVLDTRHLAYMRHHRGRHRAQE